MLISSRDLSIPSSLTILIPIANENNVTSLLGQIKMFVLKYLIVFGVKILFLTRVKVFVHLTEGTSYLQYYYSQVLRQKTDETEGD